VACRFLLGAVLAPLTLVTPGSVARAQTPTTPQSAQPADAASPTPEQLRQAEQLRQEGLRARLDSIEKASRTFKLGLSLGWRHLLARGEDAVRDATIDPATNAVRVDEIDNGAVVLSGIMTAYPWKRAAATEEASAGGAVPGAVATRESSAPERPRSWFGRNAWRVGFLANVNLAAFGAENVTTFNESIEGGIGLAYRLSDDFSWGFTVERVFSRRLRDFVKSGTVLVVDGETVTALDRTDGRFFRDDNLTALSFKFLYYLR
jgi:hypothetical protein